MEQFKMSGGTKAAKSTNADVTTSSQTIAKPIVSGSIKSEHEVINEYYPTINHEELGELYCRDKVILIMREYAEQFR